MNEEAQATEPTTGPVEATFEVLPPEPFVAPKLRHALSLANLWHVWIGMKNAAPNSLLVYNYVAKLFSKFFSGTSHKLTPQGMTEWMRYLQTHKSYQGKKMSPGRINTVNTTVRAFLRWMKRMRYINDDLAECLPFLIEHAKKESTIFTEDEYERLKAFCAGRNWCQPHLWLIILGYRTGMSLVDCCHLRWKDVHLNDDGPSYIDITRIKLQRYGDRCQIPIVPMSDLHQWLLNLKQVTPWKRFDGVTDYVHQETQGLYVTTMGNLRGDFRVLFRRAGIDMRKTFKCLRNSLCSNLVNSGMPLTLICKVTGHKSVATLLRYLKPDRRALEDGILKAQQYSAANVEEKYNTGLQPDDAAFL